MAIRSGIFAAHINPEPPEIMHIDLNSAFAMTEQQANPLLRGKPVGITNRINDYSICITASYEAKRLGISIGTRQKDARLRAPGFIMLESDAPKYQFVHRKLRAIFESYSPVAYMKSIDEGVIDFRGMKAVLKGRPLEDVAAEIKHRVKDEIGNYMTVNIGIGQNRWLAKVAASFMKPDGLLTIDRDSLESIYAVMDLVDLPYIKKRNQLRLNEAGIYTPLEFFRAPYWLLFRRVFKSVNGHHWYFKLRGYETEVQYGIRSVGRSYVLEHRTSDPEELATLLHKACHKIARRLKKNDLAARGLALGLGYSEVGWDGRYRRSGWYERKMWPTSAYRTDQLYQRALALFATSRLGYTVTSLVMTSYGLEPVKLDQPSLFRDTEFRRNQLEGAINKVNDRYGELSLVPAAVVKSKNPMKDKIPFGTVRYFD